MKLTDRNIKIIPVHRFMDTDALLGSWMVIRFVPGAADAKIVFVNAGESLPDSEDDPTVFHIDTGGKDGDHHRKNLPCSAAVIAKELGIENDPGLQALIKMATNVDNAKPLPPTSIHYVIEGYPRMFESNGGIDWSKVQERVFELFDIIYNQEKGRAQSREDLLKVAKFYDLPNGLRVTAILWEPRLREAAFEAGAAVVVWTQSRGKKGFYVGVQRNRNFLKLRLDGVVAALRAAEAKIRGIDVRGQDLGYVDREGPISNWFLHESRALILSGSRTWKLEKNAYTRLSSGYIVKLVRQALSAIPDNLVSSWTS